MNGESWRIIQISALPHFTYVVGCTRTGACAVVNPSMATYAEVARQLARHRLTIRFWLHTRRPADRRPQPDEDEVDRDEEAPMAARLRSRVIRVAPDPQGPRLNPGHDAVILRAGMRRIGVRRFRGAALHEGPWYTIGGSRRRSAVPAHIAAQARVAVGGGFVVVLPIDDDEVAFRVAGHLFTSRAATDTPGSLLQHDGDTLIHPGTMTDGLFVSTVAQETFRRASASARNAPAHPLPSQHASHDDDELLPPIELR